MKSSPKPNRQKSSSAEVLLENEDLNLYYFILCLNSTNYLGQDTIIGAQDVFSSGGFSGRATFMGLGNNVTEYDT